MPTLLKIMKRCDIDPALHAKILHITADDWQSCQRGELKVTSIDTVVCGCLLMEIFYFAFCFIGDWDMVSQWLNQVRCLPIFDNRCPLQTIKSGDIRDLADLQRVISGQVLSSPYL